VTTANLPNSAVEPRPLAGTRAIPCTIMRGGTSRGVFFHAEDLPQNRPVVDAMLLNVFGSPDVRQISGLGGASSQTSKAAIISRSVRDDADVDYTFAQVSVDQPVIDWGGNCGNMSSAVGPFAINEGLVSVLGDVGSVRIFNTNTGKIIVAQVPLVDGQAAPAGDFGIPGVPGTAARIRLEFLDPGGSQSGNLLPTSRPRDSVTLADGRRLTVSVVDAGNPVVFLSAAEIGLRGTELPTEIEANEEATRALEEARGIVASWLGIVSDPGDATRLSPGLPKVGFVAPPATYQSSIGERIPAESMDLVGRLMSMQTAHRSYMVTGAICTAAAAVVEGTLVHEVTRKTATDTPTERTVRIGHPYGVLETDVRASGGPREPRILSVTVDRTARYIMRGFVYVPERVFAESPPTSGTRSSSAGSAWSG